MADNTIKAISANISVGTLIRHINNDKTYNPERPNRFIFFGGPFCIIKTS